MADLSRKVVFHLGLLDNLFFFFFNSRCHLFKSILMNLNRDFIDSVKRLRIAPKG